MNYRSEKKVSFSLEDKKLVVTVVPSESDLKGECTGRIATRVPGIPAVSFVYLIQK